MRQVSPREVMVHAWVSFKKVQADPNNLSNLPFSTYLKTAWHVLRRPQFVIYDNRPAFERNGAPAWRVVGESQL